MGRKALDRANDTPEGKRPANRTLGAPEAMPTTASAGDARGAKTAQILRREAAKTAKHDKRRCRKQRKHAGAFFWKSPNIR